MYEFKFRKDMPSKFLKSDFIEELPYVYDFLKQYEGLRFAEESDFLMEMGKFESYISAKRISILDKGICEGICFAGLDRRVVVSVRGLGGFCCFGKLEEIND